MSEFLTKEQEEKILPILNALLYELDYVSFWDDGKVTLDGRFDADELKAIVKCLEVLDE